MVRNLKVRYAKKETGWVKPIAINRKGKMLIAVATNQPILTRKFRWGNLVNIDVSGKEGIITRKVASIPNQRDWRILNSKI